MFHRVVDPILPHEPRGRACKHALGVGAVLVEERRPKESVTAVPLLLAVERRHEQVGAVEFAQHFGRAGDLQGCVAERAGESFKGC